MLKKLRIILLTLLITLVQLPMLKADASVDANGLKVGAELTQWVLDQSMNTLYAISQKGKSLLFINATTMNLEKTLTFNGSPTDIIKDNGKLYISLDDIHQIVIVDIASRTIIKTIYTSSDPYRIEKEGDKIYYTELDQWCDIYEYNLTTNIDKKILTESFYQPDIAINPNDHILYIGESDLSGSDMIYYSTIENEIISKTYYDSGYGFPYPKRYTIFDGGKVYFAGYDFDKLNATRISGSYGEEDIIFVKHGLAFTKTSIYSSETHELLGHYDDNIDLYEISDKAVVYLYSKAENVIVRVDPSKKGWIQENGKWYYYDLNTSLKRIGWLNDRGIWYYLNNDGSMATGWLKEGANWYYLQASGAMKTGWLYTGGSWYYLDNSGSMKTGWVYTGGSWYYLNNNGAMKAGWLYTGGSWYYLDSSGAMKTGWIFSGSRWYYLYNSGKMASNTTISGYRLGVDGAWIH